MIAASSGTGQLTSAAQTEGPRWQLALSRAITDPADLLRELDLDPCLLDGARRAGSGFALKVPRGFLARMRKGDPNDPLLRQILPLDAELEDVPGFVGDPVGDLASAEGAGLLHKYHGRALLITTGACAVHCRYCFRREFPYSDHLAAAANWQPSLDLLTADTSIREVLLSGGDPLVLSDRKLRSLTDGLAQIPHIERLRIHTRLPVVLPERVDAGLKSWLASLKQRLIVVIHANHANEIDAGVERALADLAACGATLLNQSVLLKGVNDDAQALIDLSERLFAAGVLPYYLHLLDPVRGAAHFKVDDEHAVQLMQSIATALPGYLVPRLVREQAGAEFKVPIPWQPLSVV